MNILIVDGNEKNASNKYIQIGMPTQYDIYYNVLKKLDKDCKITTIHPACKKDYIPKGLNLDDFHGIVWTGSLLNIYDYGAPIERQIELAKELFDKKNNIFGSCWGLQVLATAAGGIVKKNPKGLEAVIANDITLNDNGINHPMYRNKAKKFNSFCWHYDELSSLPGDTLILSSNQMSDVQSISFSRNNSHVWAVQYHPEFNAKWISGLMKQRRSLLLDEEIYESNQFDNLYSYLSNTKKFNHLKNELEVSETIINEKIHTLEISNWLKNLMKDI